MKALLQYVQQVISSGKDGTISAMLESGEIGTLTVRKRSIVAATLEDITGKPALEALKLANIAHMEFWRGIVRKSDVQKMVALQVETNAFSPIPEDEMYPEGAPISLDDSEDEPAHESDSDSEEQESETRHEPNSPPEISEASIEALKNALIEYIGPAADIAVDSSLQQAQDTDHLVEMLCEELFTSKEKDAFRQRAYFILGHG